MKKNLIFRAWYYFRTGWGTYFAFIMAAINTLVVTYYLAIENVPILKDFFPSFTHYVLFISIIGVPILVLTGYIHFKKSAAYKSEADITIETNPHMRRILLNTETIIESELKLSKLILKMINNETLSSEESSEIKKLFSELDVYLKNKSFNEN